MTKRQDRRGGIGTVSIGAVAIAVGAAIGYALRKGGVRAPASPNIGGHVPTDLLPGKPHPGPTDRAPIAFRPDPTAPLSNEEREALRPSGPPPTMVNGADAV